MRKMKQFIIILTIGLFVSCSVSKRNVTTVSKENGIILNGLTLNSGEDEVIISRDSISLEFDVFPHKSETKESHAVKVAVTLDESNLKYFQEGEIANSNPFYSYIGTGIATGKNQNYECMYVRNSGHHYIYYKSEKDKRATVIKKHKNGKVRLKWTAKCFTIDKKVVQIKDSKIDRLYLMIFIDNNLNKTIDRDEYSLITINFRQ